MIPQMTAKAKPVDKRFQELSCSVEKVSAQTHGENGRPKERVLQGHAGKGLGPEKRPREQPASRQRERHGNGISENNVRKSERSRACPNHAVAAAKKKPARKPGRMSNAAVSAVDISRSWTGNGC